jgi:hypothetical protein
MAENTDIAAVGALAVTAAVGLFRELMPDLPDVRRSSDPEMATDVRTGYVAGSALTLGIGAVLAYLLRTHIPFTLALLIAAGLTIVYEIVLRMRGASR